MKRYSLFLVFLFVIVSNLFGQNQNIAINNDGSAPDSKAILDIKSTEKGILIPRMTTSQRLMITNLSKGLTVFDNITNSFWFYDGGSWAEMPTANKLWRIDGNSNTDPAQHFLGTTDARALVFKVNNIQHGYMYMSNVGFGNETFLNNINGFGNSGLGHKAFSMNTSGYQNSAVGYLAFSSNTTGNSNVAVGTAALKDNIAGDQNCAIGFQSLSKNDYGSNNVAVGSQSLFSNFYGDNLVAIGYRALYNNGAGEENVAVGSMALYSNSSGDENTAVGYGALVRNVNGLFNSAVGDSALANNTSGYSNCAFGVEALKENTTSNYNCAFGFRAMELNSSGFYNTALGDRAMSANLSGARNVAVGAGSLDFLTSGDYNTAIGYNSNVQSGSLNNTTAIGYGALVSVSNAMRFGNTSVNRWGFGRNVSSGVFQVGDDATNGNGAYLSAAGTWVNVSDFYKKENITQIDGQDLLKKIMDLPVSRWSYKGENGVTHIGPMAQDFYRIFNVGDDEKAISSVDPAGIALRAIQEQQKMITTQQNLIEELLKRIDKLEKQR